MSDRTNAPPQPFAELERVADELRAEVHRRGCNVGAHDVVPASDGAA